MLEDIKAESDKAPKAGLASPQSSILDFFISPNKGKPSKKPAEKEEDACPRGTDFQENDIILTEDRDDEKHDVCTSQDESADSVILLSEETSPQCGDLTTETEQLNVSGVSSRSKQKDHDSVQEKESKGIKDTVHDSSKTKGFKIGKQMTLTKDGSIGKPKVNLQNDVSVCEVSDDKSPAETLADSLEKDPSISRPKNKTIDGEIVINSEHPNTEDIMKEAGKKKRKRKSSECVDRKRSKTDPDLKEVSVDQSCSATEMSYEAFIQSVSTPGRDTTADVISPEKDMSDNEPQILEVKEGAEVIEIENTPVLPMEVFDKKPVKSKKKKSKSVRTSLFNEDPKQTTGTAVEDLTVSGGEEVDKAKKPSILNFFSRVGSPGQSDKEHQVVTVLADVHHRPRKDELSLVASADFDSSTPVKPKGPRILSPKSPGVVEMEEDIEILGSETVADVPKKRKISKSKKKISSKSSTEKVEDQEVKENDSNEEEVKIEKVEVAQRTAEVDAFLKSSDSPAVPVKSAQATLSFTKTGLKTAPATAVPHNTRVRSETDSKSAKVVDKETGSEKDVTKVKKKSGKSKKAVTKKKSEKESNCSINSNEDEESPATERRSRRVRYQVSSLQFDDSRQTPIKMKIKLKKNSSGEESDFTPKSSKVKGQKQQKAQKLLEKAKKVKKSKASKAKSKEKKKLETSQTGNDSVIDLDSSTDGGGRRRSARIAVQSPPPVPIIVEDEEENTEKKPCAKPKKGTKTPLKLKPKDSPRKTKIKNSPLKLAKDSPRKSKGSGKLASIFAGKSKTEPEKPKEPEDPEKVRLRQAFLMSDVPEMLKRKVVATVAVQNEWESVGLPNISHIQQKPDTEEGHIPWNLPPVKLPLKKWNPFHNITVQWKDMSCCRTNSHTRTNLFKDFHHHPDLTPSIVEELLGEVESAGAKGLSVRQMFTDMQQKLQDDLRSLDNADDTSDKSSQPEVVVVEEEGDKKKKGRGRGKAAGEKGETGKGRKKLSLSKGGEEKAKQESLTPDIKKIGEMMWSERYQPSHSTEVIGHTGHIQKLKSWLLEWKHRTHKEARKMRLQLLKQSHPKSAVKDDQADNAWWGEDDSDFDLDSEDSEDEDDSLCNTMLIAGPHGIGKTATVYALAQELGYKVIEVNATSSRNGKKILSKLQEATQSHQVATTKDGGSSNMLSALSNSMSNSGMSLGSPKPAKKEAKLLTAFTNLFRKAGGNKSEPLEVIDLDKEDKKKGKKQGSPAKSKRKRKRNSQDEKGEKSPKKAKKEKAKVPQLPFRDESSQSGGLELSTTTLILFDEVEVFFEEDRGYLPAIQHFMTRTKIPIILTTTDTNFGGQLQARYESLSFKQPSLVTIASHLQTICLVEHVRTCQEEMLSLVRLHRGDIRKSLLWLQYWLSSGGGAKKLDRGIRKSPRPVLVSIDDNTCSQDALTDSQEKPASHEEDDDFVVSKTSVTRKRRVLDDDESSCNSVFPTDLTSSRSDPSRSSHLPQVHCLQLEMTAGVSQPISEVLETMLHSYLKGDCEKQRAQGLQDLCQNLHSVGLPVISQNLFHLLPLPKLPLHAVSSQSGKEAVKQIKRSRIRTDLFDDEASNDSAPEIEETKSVPSVKTSDSKNEHSLNYKCLKAFSQYYDSVCSMDMAGASAEQCRLTKCYLGPAGVTDSKIVTDGERENDRVIEEPDSMVRSLVDESSVIVGMKSAKQLYGSIMDAVGSYKCVTEQGDLPETASMPVSGGRTTFSLLSSEPRLPGPIRKTHENVNDCLPLTTHCSHRTVYLDYLPSLRAISRAEHHRQIAKTKRRFQHYFDNIGLCLKESSLNVLCQTFN